MHVGRDSVEDKGIDDNVRGKEISQMEQAGVQANAKLKIQHILYYLSTALRCLGAPICESLSSHFRGFLIQKSSPPTSWARTTCECPF